MKYIQPDKFGKYSIYRNKSFGPSFGGEKDNNNNKFNLYIASGCTNNSNCYTNVNPNYKTDNKNLIYNSGQSSFQVSCYEIYHVIREL